MAYLITTFDGVPLPLYDPEQDDSAAEALSTLLDSVGGTFDYYGTANRLPRKYGIEVSGIYVGETEYLVDDADNYIVDEAGNYIIAGTAVNRLRDQIQALRAKLGVRGTLTRIRQDDNVQQTITARLLQVRHDKRQQEMARLAKLTCLFESVQTAWQAASATTTTGNATDGVQMGLTVSNGGDVTVYDATLTIARTSGTITAITIVGSGISLAWTGSTTGTLTINCGAKTVRIGSTDSYNGFSLGSGHTSRGWLPLAPGITPLVVTVTGGNATVTIRHYNQFR